MKNLLFIFLYFFASCGSFKQLDPLDPPTENISYLFTKAIEGKYPYRLCGSGGAFPNQVRGFLFDFQTELDIPNEQVENDLHELYNTLLCIINSDEKIRPYLLEWPFEKNENDIGILFFNPVNGKFRSPPGVASMHIKGGTLHRLYYDPEKDRLLYEEEYEKYKERHGISSGDY